MENLKIHSSGPTTETVEELIDKGENQRIESKETFLYKVYQDQPKKALKATVANEIAAMANSHGGNVIIGVEDESGGMQGLDRDYKLLKKGRDSIGLQLNQEISNRLNHLMEYSHTHIEFESVDGKEICLIRVNHSP